MQWTQQVRAYVYAKCNYSHGEESFLHERYSVDLSRDLTFWVSDYIPGHVSDYIGKFENRSERLHKALYTNEFAWTVINRPKSRIWASCQKKK